MPRSGRTPGDVAARPVNKTYEDVIHCEDVIGHHEVHPTVWPPRPNGIEGEYASVLLPCVVCGAQCSVDKRHGTDPDSAVKVVMPKSKVTA
jgi:hypothetical protein